MDTIPEKPTGETPSDLNFLDLNDKTTEQKFTESLPPGTPILKLNEGVNIDALARLANEHLEPIGSYFTLLSSFDPIDRAAVIKATRLDHLVESVAQARSSHQWELAKLAQAALGEDNIRIFALNLTDPAINPNRTRERTTQRAALILSQGLPLDRMEGVFAHFGNLARDTSMEVVTDPYEMVNFFNLGLYALLHSIDRDIKDKGTGNTLSKARKENEKRELSIFEYPADVIERSKILGSIINNDLGYFLRRQSMRAKESSWSLNSLPYNPNNHIDIKAANEVRSHMRDLVPPEEGGFNQPNSLDRHMSYSGFSWDPKKQEYKFIEDV